MDRARTELGPCSEGRAIVGTGDEPGPGTSDGRSLVPLSVGDSPLSASDGVGGWGR